MFKMGHSAVHNISTNSALKCMKMLFGYPKFSSVAVMLLELKLPSFGNNII